MPVLSDPTGDALIDGRWAGATPSMADTPHGGEPVSGRPKMLIMDLCGAYMRALGGWFAIAKIVQLMHELEVDETATRSALLRMRRKGLLEPERRRGVRGLRLTDKALGALEDTDRRIFGPRAPAVLADGWVLVSFSVPEEKRAHRHVLRSQLSWLGFGNLSNGLWMAPRRMLRDLERAVRELGFEQYVLMFEAHYTGFEELSDLVGNAWDLDELGTLYAQFATWCEPILQRWEGVRGPSGTQAFVDYTLAVYHWRKFPYLDPGLPSELLPADWSGHRARRMFFDLRGLLEDAALDHVRRVCSIG